MFIAYVFWLSIYVVCRETALQVYGGLGVAAAAVGVRYFVICFTLGHKNCTTLDAS